MQALDMKDDEKKKHGSYQPNNHKNSPRGAPGKGKKKKSSKH